MKLIALFALMSFAAPAMAFQCRVSVETTSGSRTDVESQDLRFAPTGAGTKKGIAEIKDCYFSAEGTTDGTQVKIFIVQGEPPASGAGIVSAGSVTSGQFRLSYVKDDYVCKVVCAK